MGLTPLPHPAPTTTRPEWIGPVHVVNVVAGTVNRAQALRVEDGRITAMVPADAGVLRRPLAVMQEGRLYDRKALDGMLEHAAGVSSGWRFTVHMLRDMARHPAGFIR